MDYFRISEFNGYTGPMFGVEYTQNDGESWITVSTHTTREIAEREMLGYVATHPGECALWEGSLAKQIHDAERRQISERDDRERNRTESQSCER